MDWLRATAQLYRTVLARAAALAVKNWPVVATIYVYLAILVGAGTVASRLGIAGGFLLSLAFAACASSFLSLVETMIRTSRVTLADFRGSFGTYLWDVIGVSFVFWIFFMLLGPLVAQLPQGAVILLCINLAIFIYFNAVPELIYLGHYPALALLRESAGFIGENWIEWFPPTLAFGAVVLAIDNLPLTGVAEWLVDALLALLVYFAMIVRGLLFIELHGSSRRSRVFKYRAGGAW
jgi:hypothetical protein